MIVLLPAEGGSARELYRLPSTDDVAPYTGLTWSPDGRDIYFGASTRTTALAVPAVEIRRVPVAGGEAQPIGVKRGPVSIFQISSDGRRIVYGVTTSGEVGHGPAQVFHSDSRSADAESPTMRAPRFVRS